MALVLKIGWRATAKERITPFLPNISVGLPVASAPAPRMHFTNSCGRLLSTLLPCSPTNHATIRNRTHHVAEEIETRTPEAPKDAPALAAEMVVMIDGAHIRAANGYQSRHLDVTVGTVDAAGFQPRRFALAPKDVDHPLTTVRAALVEQGWQPGRPLTIMSDGKAALPNLVRAATGEPVRQILD